MHHIHNIHLKSASGDARGRLVCEGWPPTSSTLPCYYIMVWYGIVCSGMVYHDVLWYGIVWYGLWGMATIFFSPLLPYSDPSRVTDSLPLPLAFLSAADTVVAHTPYCSSCKTAALASAASADFTLHNETLCAVHCMRFKLSECKAGQSRGIAQAAEADTCLIHQALSVRRLILEQEYSSVAQCGKGVTSGVVGRWILGLAGNCSKLFQNHHLNPQVAQSTTLNMLCFSFI